MKKIFLIFSVMSLFFLYGCPDKSTNPPLDPCFGAKPTTAQFTIYERKSNDISGFQIQSDTIMVYNKAYFQAIDPTADTYNWVIGTDTTVYKTPSFTLIFPEVSGPIPVRLIVTKKPILQCFPNDKGIDTIIKYINICPMTSAAINGFYYGCNLENTKDSFVVNIGCKWSKDILSYEYFIDNLDKGCKGDSNIHLDNWNPNVEAFPLYKGITFDMGSVIDQGCNNIKGNAILENGLDNIRITYNEFKTPIDYKTRVSKVFTGRRIK